MSHLPPPVNPMTRAAHGGCLDAWPEATSEGDGGVSELGLCAAPVSLLAIRSPFRCNHTERVDCPVCVAAS